MADCPKLRNLEIEGARLDEPEFEEIGKLHNVKTLSLKRVDFSGASLNYLNSMENLESLELERIEPVVEYDAWELNSDNELVPATNANGPLFHFLSVNVSLMTDDFPSAEYQAWLAARLPGVDVVSVEPEPYDNAGPIGGGGGFGGGGGAANAPAGTGSAPAGGGGFGAGPKN